MKSYFNFMPFALVDKKVLMEGEPTDPYKSVIQLTFSLGSPDATLGFGQPDLHLFIRQPNSKYMAKWYSIVSRPDERGVFRVVIKVYRGGLMSEYLDGLAINDSIYASKSFAMTMVPSTQVGLIAFGIGITEMLVTAETLLAKGSDVTLIHCIRYEREKLFTADIATLQHEYPTQFKVLYVVSKPKYDSKQEGMIPGRFNDAVAETAFGQWDKTQARFLAIGTDTMNKAAYKLLSRHGFHLRLIEMPSRLYVLWQAFFGSD
ncbi:hypothetical protein LEN26_013544 [Aphanomyces euteiches]|nr:hypothetical protein AeMF1_021298 [Aphanomyces euteiches]KAH9111104.1 hypothetical protein LEN26_013544 [Aphanomyces euteiches]